MLLRCRAEFATSSPDTVTGYPGRRRLADVTRARRLGETEKSGGGGLLMQRRHQVLQASSVISGCSASYLSESLRLGSWHLRFRFACRYRP